MDNPILSTIGLTKRYGDFYANTDVSISVKPASIHGVIGPNGAGKTTLFNCLAGTVSVSSGEILLGGKAIHKLGQHRRPSLGMGRSFQVTSLFQELTALENLRLAGQALLPAHGFVFWRAVTKRGSNIEYANYVLERLGLEKERNKLVIELSHGQQRLLEVGMAIMSKPRVLLLDEPTSGMGVDDVPQMIKLLKNLRDECTILVIEHNIRLVTEVCDKVSVLQAGKVIAEGTPQEISENQLVKTAYLGEDL